MTVTHTDGQSFTITLGSLTETQKNGQNFFSQTTSLSDPGGNPYTIEYGNADAPNASSYDVAYIAYPGTPATIISFAYADLSGFDFLQEVDYNGVPYDYTSYVTDLNSQYYGWATGTYLADNTDLDSVSYAPNSAGNLVSTLTNPLGHVSTHTYAGINGQLSSVSSNAVADCGATVSSRSYDTNGNLSKEVDNNGNLHTYNFAANGQLQTETEAAGTSVARITDYEWDTNLQLNRMHSVTVEGWSKTTYNYNAQNRLASVVVTNLSSNGVPNETLTTSYTYTLYSNGMVHTMSVTTPSPGGSDTDVYTYDTLGNVSSLADGLGHKTAYSNYNSLGEVRHVVGPNGDATDYTYDARGRVLTKTTYPYGIAGSWTSTYDGFGLLYTLTTPDNETTTWNRDAEMRVKGITHNDKDGSSGESFAYDANGDVTGLAIFRVTNGVPDLGFKENAQYDALGRLYQKIGQNGQTLTYGYDGNGNVVSVTNALGHLTTMQYDALNRVSKTIDSGGASSVAAPIQAPVLTAPATSTGSYAITWSGISGATRYELQELAGGVWNNVQNGAGSSWSTTGRTNGSYGYRVEACNISGCSPWSTVATVTVSAATVPASAPVLQSPGNSSNGSYTIGWSGVANTNSYNLQEQVNASAWATVQATPALSWSTSGRANGNYLYRVQACNAVGCGSWSSALSLYVVTPIAANGASYASAYTIPSPGSGFAGIGFDLTGSTSWEVYTSNPHALHTVVDSGAVPATAATVKYTWTLVGVPSGDNDAGGSVSNPATSAQSLASNPTSNYTTATFSAQGIEHGRTYQLKVDFYNAAGVDISSATCTLTASVAGSQ